MRERVTHCLRGHKYTEENTYWSKTGGRGCRTCSRERHTRINREKGYLPRPAPTMPAKTEIAVLAYAAGIIDGEGSIGIVLGRQASTNKPKYHRLVIRATSTDPRLIEWLAKNFGGKTRLSHVGKAKQSPAHNWSLLSRHAEAFLRLVRPYLVIKGEQADVGLALRASTGAGRSRPVTEELFLYREGLRQQIHQLNRRRRLLPQPPDPAQWEAKEFVRYSYPHDNLEEE